MPAEEIFYLPLTELAKRIGALIGYEGRIEYDTSRPDGAPHKIMDGSRGEALLGWSPQVGLDEGLRRTVEWYMKTKEDLKEPVKDQGSRHPFRSQHTLSHRTAR